MVSTAKTKKPVKKHDTEEVVTNVAVANCTEYVSIAFDKNGNLYGVTKHGELFKFDWTSRSWVAA